MPRPAEPDDDLPPAEWARDRRRDHDAGAGARSGMRTGLAKQFKQVLDVQVQRARRPDEVPDDDGAMADDDRQVRPRRRREPRVGT